ncbi:tudor domain-containing protein 5-like isoform X2 [Festucalex cinctus]
MSTHKTNKEQVLAQLKKDVRSLLISSKNGLGPNQLVRDYGNMLGHPMPLQLLGFGTIMDMAMAMPDVISVTYGINGCPILKAVSDTSTKHIEQLVAMQRTPKRKSTGYSRQYQPAPILYRRKVFLSLETFRAQLQIILCQGPVKLYDLSSCYLRCFRRPLNPHNFGFNTVREMLEAVADLVFVQPTNMGLILSLRRNDSVVPFYQAGLFYTPNRLNNMPHRRIVKQGKPSAPAAAAEKEQEADPDLDQKPLLEPSGKDVPLIKNNHLPTQPAEGDKGHCTVLMGSDGTGGESLSRVDSSQMDSIDNGVTNAHEDNLAPLEGKIEEGDDCCSVEAHQDETLDTSEDFHTQEESPEKKPDTEVCPHLDVALDDVVRNQRLKRPTRHDVRKVMPIQVEHVESPGHFYISFFESDESRALLDMMFEMRRFYNCPEVSELYRLPQRFVRRGQACCVSAAGCWFYRVVIQRVASASQVEVYFVDYGKTSMVNSDNLKFIKMCFSNLPAQAVPSTLAGIRPLTGAWTPEAIACFQSLCTNHVLMGALECYTGDVLQLSLYSTHTSRDVNIHDVMISKGHAVACWPSDRICVRNSPVSLYLGDDTVDLRDVEEMSDEMPCLELITEEQWNALKF